MACPPEDFAGLSMRLFDRHPAWRLVCFYPPPVPLPPGATVTLSSRSMWIAARVWLWCLRARPDEAVVCCRTLEQPSAIQSLVEFVSVLPVSRRAVLDASGAEQPVRKAGVSSALVLAFVPLLLWFATVLTMVGLRVVPARSASVRPARRRRVAVVVPILPDLSHTFVYREVLALKARHPDYLVINLEQGDPSVVHREASQLQSLAMDVPRLSTAAYLAMYIRRWMTQPVRTAAMVRAVQPHTASFAPGWLADDALCFLRMEHLQHSNYVMLGLVLADLLDRHDVGYVHVYGSTYPALRAFVAHHATGAAFSVSTFVDFDYPTPFHMLEQKFGAARFVVACTRYCEKQLVSRLPALAGRVRVLRHGLPRHYADGAVFRPTDGRSRIVFVGRFVEKKGLDTLLDSLRLLTEDEVAFTAHLYGSGPLESALRTRSRALGLDDRVFFEGPLRNQDFYTAVNHDDVFVCPSRYLPDGERDGIPVTLLEAMAAGITVVSTTISGIPELIVPDVNGYLVVPDDPGALARTLRDLLEHPDRRAAVRQAAVATIRRQFMVETSAGHLAEWITQESESGGGTVVPASVPVGDSA
jgi:glycosyltransferase involved in cell wall biosynthesis